MYACMHINVTINPICQLFPIQVIEQSRQLKQELDNNFPVESSPVMAALTNAATKYAKQAPEVAMNSALLACQAAGVPLTKKQAKAFGKGFKAGWQAL